MIFEALFLAFTLGSERAQQKAAAIKAKSMMNDQETMRREFFAKSRKWKEDMFSFGDILNGLQWNRFLELLDLIDEGYFPVGCVININKRTELQLYGLEKYTYKEILDSGSLAHIYLKLSDVKDYFEHGNTCEGWISRDGRYHSSVMVRILDLLESEKVRIGLPFGEGDEMKIMTTSEARTFMADIMEERFQKYYKIIRGR